VLTLRILAGVALTSWVWLALARGMYWRTNIRLPLAVDPTGTPWPSVAIIVPARDEVDVLPLTLSTLVAQDYPGRKRVILVDDNSTDGTAAFLADRWPDITVIGPGEPPAGWAGKLWALRAGIAAADGATIDAATADGVETDRAGIDVATADGAETDSAGSDAATADGAETDNAENDRAGSVEATADGAENDRAGTNTATIDSVMTEAATTDTAARHQDDSFDYLLFTDADIAHESDSLTLLVRAAEANQLDLVSQMARLRVRTGWERLIVPAFVYFFALLYPFRWSNKVEARTAAAAGGCSLVRRTALVRAGGLDVIRDAVIDDVALARAIKRAGGRTFLGLADHVDSIRPYPELGSLWQMVARSAFAQLHRSLTLLVGTVVGLALVFWVPPACLVIGAATVDVPTLLLGAAGYALMTALYVPMLRYYRLPWALALVLPFTATLYLGMTVDSAVQHFRGRGAAWKGRTYSGRQSVIGARRAAAANDQRERP
jgi:Glycosyltransferases involved in cell wall biogenesis